MNKKNMIGNPELREISFDKDWQFFRGDAKGAERENFDDTHWKKLSLPHDWSIEDLPDSDDVKIPCFSPVQGTWKLAFGDNPSWKEPGFTDIFWKDINLPCAWKEYGAPLENIYGWLRRRVLLPPETRGRDMILDMGLIGDADETHVNGKLVGKSGEFPKDKFIHASAANYPRFYKVPAELTSSEYIVIAVRIFDKTGNGGIHSLNQPPETAWKRIGPFDPFESEGGKHTGHFVGGTGWYRKSFAIPEGMENKISRIVFDGSYMDTDVWINGKHLGKQHYGYTAFSFDLTPYLKKRNVIAVRIQNHGLNSRWYSGSGLYRHVKFMSVNPVHVALWGISVSTIEINENSADIKVSVTVNNKSAAREEIKVKLKIISPDGASISETGKKCIAENYAGNKCTFTLSVTSPELWEPEKTSMYRAEIELLKNGETLDTDSVSFGIRTVSVSAQNGFMLNGKTIKLKGGCIHHDNGLLGAVSVSRAEERRIEILKAAGYNAVRCSHNPPSSVFLDVCDRLGMLVIDEAFDHWLDAKTPMDYHRFFNECWRKDLEAMIYRDFNHPSVVIWSIGNEIPDQYKPENYRCAWMLANHVRALDPSRPVTQASWIIPDIEEKKFKYLDIIGYNYCLSKYERDHNDNPNGVYLATESYPKESFEYWQAVENMPCMAGDFIWTAWDYFGESGCGKVNLDGRPHTRGEWPWHIANCGDFDICGFPKPQSFYRQVLWGASKVEMLVHEPLPDNVKEDVSRWGWPFEEKSWTWHGHEGKNMQVRVFADGERVDISLNGKKIDSKPAGKSCRYISEFSVPYTPGELKAEVFSGGKKIAEDILLTAGAPARLKLSADKTEIGNSQNELIYLTVELLDAKGIPVPDKTVKVNFLVSGPAVLAAAGNGNPIEVASMRKPFCNTWKGRCLAIVKPDGTPGKVLFQASAEGMENDEIEITLPGNLKL